MTNDGLLAFVAWCRMNKPTIVYDIDVARRVWDAYEYDPHDHLPGIKEAHGYPSVTECPSCSGTGKHSDWEFLPRCPTCKGSGEVPDDDDSYPSVTHESADPIVAMIVKKMYGEDETA